MFKKERAPLGEKDLQPTWEYLIRQERLLLRNRTVCRIVQPVGSVIFLLNLLLATCNFGLFLLGDRLSMFFDAIPVLPKMIRSFPRESWSGMIVFSVCFVYLIPLAISGGVMLTFWLLDRKKHAGKTEPLTGSISQQAKALANKAESVYELRRQIPIWSIFIETGILTALTALPLLIALFRTVSGSDPAVFQTALYCLALLVVLFVLFWVYALLFKLFSLLNSLFYFSAGEWTYYDLYQKLDAYWESVDPREYARREEQRRRLEERKLRNRWMKKREAKAQEDSEE